MIYKEPYKNVAALQVCWLTVKVPKNVTDGGEALWNAHCGEHSHFDFAVRRACFGFGVFAIWRMSVSYWNQRRFEPCLILLGLMWWHAFPDEKNFVPMSSTVPKAPKKLHGSWIQMKVCPSIVCLFFKCTFDPRSWRTIRTHHIGFHCPWQVLSVAGGQGCVLCTDARRCRSGVCRWRPRKPGGEGCRMRSNLAHWYFPERMLMGLIFAGGMYFMCAVVPSWNGHLDQQPHSLLQPPQPLLSGFFTYPPTCVPTLSMSPLLLARHKSKSAVHADGAENRSCNERANAGVASALTVQRHGWDATVLAWTGEQNACLGQYCHSKGRMLSL